MRVISGGFVRHLDRESAPGAGAGEQLPVHHRDLGGHPEVSGIVVLLEGNPTTSQPTSAAF